MANSRAIFVAALFGGIVGGALVWIIAQTGAPASDAPGKKRATAVPLVARSDFDTRRQSRERHEMTRRGSTHRRRIETGYATAHTGQLGDNYRPPRTSSDSPILATPDLSAGAPGNRSITAIQQVTAVTTLQTRAADSIFSQKSPVPKATAAGIESALSYALQAADRYLREGFTVREDYWAGVLTAGSTKAIVHQLFRGNEYWFWLGTDVASAAPAIHIYDPEGNLAEAEHWQSSQMAAARIVPTKSGTYYLMVTPQGSPRAQVSARLPWHWAVAYGFR